MDGWTHSLIVLDDYDPLNSPRYFETYRFPLEVVLTNWGALNSLLKRLEKARAIFFKEIEVVEKSSFKYQNYTKIARDIREFTLKVERIMQSFDSYTVSNNPMLYKLIEMQQEVFLEHKSIGRIKNQIDLVSQIINELSHREKSISDSRLSKVLLMLTGLTIIDISKTIFEVVKGGTIAPIPFLCILSSLLIILLIGYKADFQRKKNRESS